MKNLFSTLPPPLPLAENVKKPPTKQKQEKAKGKGKGKGKEPVEKPKPNQGKYKKQKISAALREQVWIQHSGRVFERKCTVIWCKNTITVFDFQCGHDIPESKGGRTDITNLYPICGKCNLSMSNTYTLKEWSALYNAMPDPEPMAPRSSPEPQKPKNLLTRFFSCFTKR